MTVEEGVQAGSSTQSDRLEARAFTAYVAHELRTPLATQRALLELALADPDADSTAWSEVASRVLDSCKHQERLLDACLALSRGRRGLSRREIVDLGSLTVRLLGTTALDGLRARACLREALTLGDSVLIERLVDNLLANAVRHNRDGGWIALASCRRGSQAILTIENSGPLLSATEVTGLFEPFPPEQWRLSRPAGGLGLGLVVVKAVADAHGAQIAACVRPQGGLRIEVAFPWGA